MVRDSVKLEYRPFIPHLNRLLWLSCPENSCFCVVGNGLLFEPLYILHEGHDPRVQLLPFCPFLRANLSDWIEALLFLTKRNQTLCAYLASMIKSWKYPFLAENVLVLCEDVLLLLFFFSDLKELTCYLLNFPQLSISESQQGTSNICTYLPGLESLKYNKQHQLQGMHPPLLVQDRESRRNGTGSTRRSEDVAIS